MIHCDYLDSLYFKSNLSSHFFFFFFNLFLSSSFSQLFLLIGHFVSTLLKCNTLFLFIFLHPCTGSLLPSPLSALSCFCLQASQFCHFSHSCSLGSSLRALPSPAPTTSAQCPLPDTRLSHIHGYWIWIICDWLVFRQQTSKVTSDYSKILVQRFEDIFTITFALMVKRRCEE